MPPAYVKPYVKRGKTDAADAEAICEAVTRPTMRFVAVKSHGEAPSVPPEAAKIVGWAEGLVDNWSGKIAFVNPPFSELLRWLRRAHNEWRKGKVETVVCLVPVRTDSAVFHDTLSADADMFLLRGRVRFLDPRGGAQQTPFSLMVLTLGATAEQKKRYAELVPGIWLARVATAGDPVRDF